MTKEVSRFLIGDDVRFSSLRHESLPVVAFSIDGAHLTCSSVNSLPIDVAHIACPLFFPTLNATHTLSALSSLPVFAPARRVFFSLELESNPGRGLAPWDEDRAPPDPEGRAYLRRNRVFPPGKPAQLRHLP